MRLSHNYVNAKNAQDMLPVAPRSSQDAPSGCEKRTDDSHSEICEPQLSGTRQALTARLFLSRPKLLFFATARSLRERSGRRRTP